MRQSSWSGWASIRPNLPRWAGVPLLVALAIMASLGYWRSAKTAFRVVAVERPLAKR
jgi:hypothetical protein